MSKRRSVEIKPGVDGSAFVEAVARFRHDGVDRRPGDVVELAAIDAAELIALGFARPARNAGYQRRDQTAKG